MTSEISRRSFLKLAALAGSAAAAEACRPQKGTKLIPYLVPDQDVIPGVPAFYRTGCFECGAGCGVVARVREGRVIKLEGNPENPINAGALCARGQAALQGLYNPDRLAGPCRRDQSGSLNEMDWQDALQLLTSDCKQAAAKGQNRVAFFGRPRDPSFHDAVTDFLRAFNSTRLNYYEPLTQSAAIEATQSCFGRSDLPAYRIDQSRVLLSFGADLLETWRSPVEFSRQYAAFRTPKKSSPDHLVGLAYYVGPRMSLTAAKTDYYCLIL
jgi:anaerobic selenocysteine-containing dehydrogenase